MNTIFIHTTHDCYEIQHIGLTIFIVKRNHKPITFSMCPEEVQDEITDTLTALVLAKISDPYRKS